MDNETNLLNIVKEKCNEGLIINVDGYLNSPLVVCKETKNQIQFLMQRTCHNTTWMSFALHQISTGLKLKIDNWTYSDRSYIINDFKLAWTLAKLLQMSIKIDIYNFTGEEDEDIFAVANNYYDTVHWPRLQEKQLLKELSYKEARNSFD